MTIFYLRYRDIISSVSSKHMVFSTNLMRKKMTNISLLMIAEHNKT